LLPLDSNYVKFEEWIMPILDEMHKEQTENGVSWTPSKVISRDHEQIVA
jgi:deoxyhypusine synthase